MKSKDGYWFPDHDTHFNMYTFGYGELYELEPLLKNKRVAIDGGAHVGGWSREMAKMFDCVYCFEPSPVNYECLKANLDGVDNVVLENKALGDKVSRGTLHPPVNDGNSGAAWVVEGNDFEVVTIDSLELDDVDFIKLDVEGFEPFAVTGAEETIQRCKPVVLVEQKPVTARYGLPYMEAGERLNKMGYRLEVNYWNDFVYVPA